MNETPEPPSLTETFVKSIIDFPAFVFTSVLSVVLALLTDWETLVLFVGAGLIAYATEDYYLVGGALAIGYSLSRVLGDIVSNHAQATSLYGRIIRDNPPREQPVAITQVPTVLTQTLPPLDETAKQAVEEPKSAT